MLSLLHNVVTEWLDCQGTKSLASAIPNLQTLWLWAGTVALISLLCYGRFVSWLHTSKPAALHTIGLLWKWDMSQEYSRLGWETGDRSSQCTHSVKALHATSQLYGLCRIDAGLVHTQANVAVLLIHYSPHGLTVHMATTSCSTPTKAQQTYKGTATQVCLQVEV